MSSTLHWTDNPPSEPGHYWHRFSDSTAYPSVRRVYEFGGELQIHTEAGYVPVDVLDGAVNQWAGPLPEPQ